MSFNGNLPELSFPDWQNSSKIIGYGVFSLVFQPPALIPNIHLFPEAQRIIENPSSFVGLITTYDQYRKEIEKSTKLLMDLRRRNVQFSKLTVLPFASTPNSSFLTLRKEQIQQLVEKHYAVRKKVEYQRTWMDKSLIQIIYPYAGKPVAQFCKNPQHRPTWDEFFRCITEVAQFLIALHDSGYVHGDLSPNNLLYEETTEEKSKFTIVDWNMLSKAEDFLKQKKGNVRVGCWSPEHFCLTTSRLEEADEGSHWQMYAEEMQKYIERTTDFISASYSTDSIGAIRKYFEPYTQELKNEIFHRMYDDLKIIANLNPSSIGKYHDIRYFMDTIAKCVCNMFPQQTESQQKRYKSFLSLCLMQNLPDRKVYLEDPDRLMRRLSMILEACRDTDEEITPLHNNDTVEPESEKTLWNLLNN